MVSYIPSQLPDLKHFLDRFQYRSIALANTAGPWGDTPLCSSVSLAHTPRAELKARQVFFNLLWIMTVISLLIASTRDPGRPDPELAPRVYVYPATCGTPDEVCSKGEGKGGHIDGPHESSAGRLRPKSLRFLKNTYWMNSRITKDHASPLPLDQTPRKTQSAWFPQGDDECDEELSTRHPMSQCHPDEEKQALLAPAGLRVKPNDSSSTSPHVTKAPAWCSTCNAWKPDRSHHCRWCGRCCLKSEWHWLKVRLIPVDHHCIWLGTCVGFHNCA